MWLTLVVAGLYAVPRSQMRWVLWLDAALIAAVAVVVRPLWAVVLLGVVLLAGSLAVAVSALVTLRRHAGPRSVVAGRRIFLRRDGLAVLTVQDNGEDVWQPDNASTRRPGRSMATELIYTVCRRADRANITFRTTAGNDDLLAYYPGAAGSPATPNGTSPDGSSLPGPPSSVPSVLR